MNSAPPVVAVDLTKRFGSLLAVDGIDFIVDEGSCVGFLGPNGAGKTTTVRMISCSTPITAGRASVLGLDASTSPRRIKAQIGVCPQEDNLDPDLTVEKNLLVYARYFDIPGNVAKTRTTSLLELMQLGDKKKAKIDELSGGMKRRLILARSMLNSPRLLILDEPTTGLDPQARHLIWERISRLRDDGTPILITTHYMEEARRLCDRVILMDMGRILLNGNPRDLIANEVGREVIELWNLGDEIRDFLSQTDWSVEEVGDRVYIREGGDGVAASIIGQRFPDQERLIRHATLEDVFLLKTGRTLRD